MTVILFDNIRSSMIWYFPSFIACAAELKISIMRIQVLSYVRYFYFYFCIEPYIFILKKNFLLLGEVENQNKQSLNAEDIITRRHMSTANSNIDFKEVTVKWPRFDVKENRNVLSDVSFTVCSCKIMMIVGHVGSGKVSK